MGDALGEAAGLTEAAGVAVGLTLAAGDAAGLAAGDGDGWAVPAAPSRTTEFGLLNPGKEKSSAINIKIIAATTVAFSSGFCAPRGPKAV